MITLQRSNPTVTQILAAHGCHTTALQDRYDIHTACASSCSSFAFPLGLLRLSHIAPNNDNHTDTSLRGGGDVPVCVRRRRLSHSGTELVCLAQCISGVCVVPWDSRPSPLGMGIMLESDSDIIPLIMPLLFRLFHLLLKKGRLFFRDR
jgi:hypothetical protein